MSTALVSVSGSVNGPQIKRTGLVMPLALCLFAEGHTWPKNTASDSKGKTCTGGYKMEAGRLWLAPSKNNFLSLNFKLGGFK